MGSWRSEGVASFYGPGGLHGRFAADGSRFDQMASTAAHKTLPFKTRVRIVTAAGLSEIVTITDRGPFIRGRDIDLSLGTARRLGIEKQGVARVQIEVLR